MRAPVSHRPQVTQDSLHSKAVAEVRNRSDLGWTGRNGAERRGPSEDKWRKVASRRHYTLLYDGTRTMSTVVQMFREAVAPKGRNRYSCPMAAWELLWELGLASEGHDVRAAGKEQGGSTGATQLPTWQRAGPQAGRGRGRHCMGARARG